MKLAAVIMIVRQSLRQHLAATLITACSVGLGAGLVMSVFGINAQTRRAFIIDHAGFDAVLGARGSKLQLVMNAVYHLESSPGNLQWKLYETLKKDRRVKLAIPYALGDNYQGFRIVGTTPELFTEFNYRKDTRYDLQGGTPFTPDSSEAVIGSFVAQRTGLKQGDVFHAYHGLTYDPGMKHEGGFTVTAVMAPTNTPADRALWIPIDSMYRMEGHVLRGSGKEFAPEDAQEIPDAHKEVSAVLLKFSNPMAGFQFEQLINRQGKVATLAFPVAQIMLELFEKIGWITKVLEAIAYLVVLVAAAGTVASLYATMNERRREFAILRALGARRLTVFAAIVGQAAAISAIGAVIGYAVYFAVMAAVAHRIRIAVGVHFDILAFTPALWITPLGVIVIGALSGLLPAWKAYKTDVAAGLANDH